jgi:hypothetical protein
MRGGNGNPLVLVDLLKMLQELRMDGEFMQEDGAARRPFLEA